MPQAELHGITIQYEVHGHGKPLLLLHAGWGLAINGFAYQQRELADEFRMIVPDRRGYGRSTRVDRLGADFHWQAADDMIALLDALKIDRVSIWGHSDGAVIGAIVSIQQPNRVRGLIFEGGHLYTRKPHVSKASMLALMNDPLTLPEAAQIKLAEYNGEDWPQIIRNWAGAWIELDQRAGDLYHDRLGEIKCPTLVIHGGHDEHSMLTEIEALTRLIPKAQLSFYPEAGHSVHDGRGSREACTAEVRAFLKSIP
jgi:pimeloyl-ACP methyl ester carboxylesterase